MVLLIDLLLSLDSRHEQLVWMHGRPVSWESETPIVLKPSKSPATCGGRSGEIGCSVKQAEREVGLSEKGIFHLDRLTQVIAIYSDNYIL